MTIFLLWCYREEEEEDDEGEDNGDDDGMVADFNRNPRNAQGKKSM